MGGPTAIDQAEKAFPPVLLCLPGNAEASAKLLSEQYCGHPLLFHQLQHLHAAGARKILLSVETVPGSLVAIIDDLSLRGIDARIVRSPAEIIAEVNAKAHFLVAKAELWFEPSIVEMVASSNRSLIATVEENAENSQFERIDLNRRWAGIGLFDSAMLQSFHDIPDDWDMGSSLLRQALQQQPMLHLIRQADVQAGCVVHLAEAMGYSGLFAIDFTPKGWVESRIFKTVTQKVANLAWQSPMAHNVAVWAFPALALLCISLVTLGQFAPAALVAVSAIWAADVRYYVLASEYQKIRVDLPKILGWIMLGLSVAAALYLDQEIPFDALLSAGLVVGLQWHSLKLLEKPIISPIVLAVFIFVGATLGVLAISVKFLAAVQLIALLTSSNSKNALRLKAN
jgi:hypothetical protein